MNDFETQLSNLDEQLLDYEPSTRWIFYGASVIGILVLGWMFYLSDSVDELSVLENQNSSLLKEIFDNSPEVYRAKIEKSAAVILIEKQRNIALENEKQTLVLQMSVSQRLIFDNRHYAKMLDFLLERSVKLGLKIEFLESEDTNKTFFGKIKQFKKLSISGVGSFSAIADFLTFIESQNTLVEIENTQINSDEAKPRFKTVILYMGVAL